MQFVKSPNMLQCYNRGCGQQYDPDKNTDESCCHHPGEPFFHDAYKGWTCCNRKSVDFTEFLNMKGCTFSKHSNEKPPEPEKPPAPVIEEEIPVRKPIPAPLKRPPFDTPLTRVIAEVAPTLRQSIDSLVHKEVKEVTFNDILIGTACKNGGCKCSYTSPDSDESECQYHPGVPIFHEGMKYWSCCQKKTTDFTTFLNQAGCSYGIHKWVEENDKKTINCRYDWHQTPSDVIVAIYAKLYHYEKSCVEVNPVRLKVNLIFPDQNNMAFALDLELRGIIDVSKTTAKMFGTKVEITMPKAEVCTWSHLHFPKAVETSKRPDASDAVKQTSQTAEDSESDFDLDDIEAVR